MNITVKEAAELVGGKIFGNENLVFSNVAKIEEAENSDLTFLYHPAFEKFLEHTDAAVILINAKIKRTRKDITYVEVEYPNFAFQKIIETYFAYEQNLENIDESSFISETAKLGSNISIGKNVVISDGCEIGDNSKIFHNTVLMNNVKIGSDCLLFPNITIRENCIIGDNVILHAGVVIGSDGFGYLNNSERKYVKIPQIGNVIIENNVEIGANTTIDRAALGSTIIKSGTKIDNLVQIAHNVEIGSDTAISSQTGISGSSKVGSNCILAGQVGLADHIEIGDNVLIGAQSGVPKSLPSNGRYFGYPAKDMRTSLRLEAHIRNLPNYSKKIKELEKKLEILSKKLDDKT